jgi:hypothetical protein
MAVHVAYSKLSRVFLFKLYYYFRQFNFIIIGHNDLLTKRFKDKEEVVLVGPEKESR